MFVGFSWQSSDENKFQQTFGMGQRAMHSFLDLKDVAFMLGYRAYGLIPLCRKILGVHFEKDTRVMHDSALQPAPGICWVPCQQLVSDKVGRSCQAIPDEARKDVLVDEQFRTGGPYSLLRNRILLLTLH